MNRTKRDRVFVVLAEEIEGRHYRMTLGRSLFFEVCSLQKES